ncbi:Nmad5 family putative nucleotide modification protein [Chryseobacterium sp. 2R14A]|uniref:Nmad5 family putative nucleotide modification protein n=1 Tax=Chryseobacterium sp. 2R14A TaxID=3380353 RepID=UPI003CEFB20B
MSRYITKERAHITAKKLVDNLEVKIREKKQKLSEIVSEIYLKDVPTEIINLFKTNKKYFLTASTIRCEGNGLNKGFDLTSAVPSKNGSWSVCILPNAIESKKILKISNEFEDLKEKRDALKKQIENTLLSLKTYNRIQKDFPEAYDLLPDKDATVNTLAVPIEDIRTQLEALKS